jgi:cyclohexa-1,5-dienecarbonyl-CoA hydratase
MSVRVELDDGVGRLTLAAPPLNILSCALMEELRAGLGELAGSGARVVLLAADGPHFSAGASVEEHLPPHFETMIPAFLKLFRALYFFPLPLIAAVRGRCLGGGCEVASAADIVIAAEDATFGVPEIRLGVFPPAATALLPQLVGAPAAAELVLTGDALGAADAARLGLVARVVPEASLEAEALALARRVARNSAPALRLAKQALRAGTGEVVAQALARAGELYTNELMRTHDATEGLVAFTEKRAPVWSHA